MFLTGMLIFLIASMEVFSQPPGRDMSDKKEEIESMKIAFITKRLDLSSADSQKFWPVYNELDGELEKMRKDHRSGMREFESNFNELSDAQIDEFLQERFSHRQEELDLRKSYHARFKEVLSMQQVAKLYKAEEDFKRELLKMLRKREQQGRRSDQRR
jgi:hypothetical protein